MSPQLPLPFQNSGSGTFDIGKIAFFSIPTALLFLTAQGDSVQYDNT
jgi:hypothetical protein